MFSSPFSIAVAPSSLLSFPFSWHSGAGLYVYFWGNRGHPLDHVYQAWLQFKTNTDVFLRSLSPPLPLVPFSLPKLERKDRPRRSDIPYILFIIGLSLCSLPCVFSCLKSNEHEYLEPCPSLRRLLVSTLLGNVWYAWLCWTEQARQRRGCLTDQPHGTVLHSLGGSGFLLTSLWRLR